MPEANLGWKMPRKRRKSSFQSKPSLIFTESPVNIVKNVPSPVMCARYPPTAASVPVEDLQHLTWVSPQFSTIPSTMSVFGRRRITRHRRNISANGTNKENTYNHLPRPLHRNKFQSLRFIGEKTIEESAAEDINISYDSVSNSDIDSGNDIRISEQESPVNQDTKQTGRISRKKQTKKRCSDRLNRINFERDKQSTPVTPSDSDCQEIPTCNQSSSLDLTKLKPKSVMKSPVKRLFASQIKSCDTENDLDLSNNFDIVSTIPTESDTNEVDNIKETDISLNLSSDIDHVSNSDCDLDPVSPLTTAGLRRSLRIQMLRQMLEGGASQDKDTNVVSRVLVPDTPEDKYDWTLKKYQIRKYLKNKR